MPGKFVWRVSSLNKNGFLLRVTSWRVKASVSLSQKFHFINWIPAGTPRTPPSTRCRFYVMFPMSISNTIEMSMRCPHSVRKRRNSGDVRWTSKLWPIYVKIICGRNAAGILCSSDIQTVSLFSRLWSDTIWKSVACTYMDIAMTSTHLCPKDSQKASHLRNHIRQQNNWLIEKSNLHPISVDFRRENSDIVWMSL